MAYVYVIMLLDSAWYAILNIIWQYNSDFKWQRARSCNNC